MTGEPGAAYLALKWLHVALSAVVLGVLVLWPLLPAAPPTGDPDRATARRILGYLHRATKLLVVPSLVLIFVTGFLMLVPPITVWDVLATDGRWIILGMVAWVALAGVVGGFLMGLARELYQGLDGDASRARVEKLWRQWRAGALAGTLLTLAAIWVMVFKPPLG